MNLRIPNLFKLIKNKIVKQTSMATEKKKAELTKDERISHGGNGSKSHAESYRRKLKTPKEIMHRANFGTFSPVNPNRQY